MTPPFEGRSIMLHLNQGLAANAVTLILSSPVLEPKGPPVSIPSESGIPGNLEKPRLPRNSRWLLNLVKDPVSPCKSRCTPVSVSLHMRSRKEHWVPCYAARL